MGASEFVFVVDDDASVRRSLEHLLRWAGWDVEAFDSPAAFLARAKPDTNHCLILDLELPGLNGLELQERMATAYKDTPIIFITAHGDIPSSVRAMKAGAFEFMTKPFDDDALLESIERAIAKNRHLRGARAEREALRARYDALSPRERDVLRLVVTGLLNKQVAAELGLAESTVKIHRGKVMATMRASSLADLVIMSQALLH